MQDGGRTFRALLICAIVAFAGCRQEVYHGLEETEANRMVVALEERGIAAEKERDSKKEGRWVVTVDDTSTVDAWRVLEHEGLPRPSVQGFDAFYPSGGLVPTANEERVLLQYATAQELRKSLLTIDRVVDARVNLVLPEKPKIELADNRAKPPRASVLVKYRTASADGAPPVDEREVRALIAGGVEGLEPSAVTVMVTPVERTVGAIEPTELTRVGPVAVAPESKTTLQMLIIGMGLLVVALSGGLAFMLFRMRRGS